MRCTGWFSVPGPGLGKVHSSRALLSSVWVRGSKEPQCGCVKIRTVMGWRRTWAQDNAEISNAGLEAPDARKPGIWRWGRIYAWHGSTRIFDWILDLKLDTGPGLVSLDTGLSLFFQRFKTSEFLPCRRRRRLRCSHQNTPYANIWRFVCSDSNFECICFMRTAYIGNLP